MIACLYPRPLLSVADLSRTAASAASFIAGYRVAVLVLLAPKFHFFFLCAFDASFAHFLVVLDFSLRELAVLPEDDVEAQAENAEGDQYDSS